MGFITEWVKTAPADDFWIVAIILVVVTVSGFVGAFYNLLRKRIIQDMPTSKTRSAAQGYVELAGRSELLQGDTISAPLTSIGCVWYSYSIEEYRRSGKNSSWVTIEESTSDALFLLIDETGQAIIDPEGAAVTPAVTDIWHGHSRFPEKQAGTRKRGWFNSGAGRYRYTEERIHPGDPLYVIGLFSTSGGNTTYNVNNDVRNTLREWKQNSELLLQQFDANGDKKIDMEEWKKARASALEQVLEQHQEMKKLPAVNMMSKTCDTRRPYLLSAQGESGLVRTYSRNTSLCIVTFFIAGILATWLINLRLSD